MLVCRDCGSIVYEEIYDEAVRVMKLNAAQLFNEELYTTLGNKLEVRCHKCKSTHLVDIQNIDYKRKAYILNALSDEDRLKRLNEVLNES